MLEDSCSISVQIIDTLVQVVHKAACIDNQPIDLGDGTPLSAAEIHLIDIVGRFPGDTLSEIAIRLGVTKGAVSQMVQKLEMKGCIRRARQEGNRKNISLNLTDLGNKAFLWHQTLHYQINSTILSGLSDLAPGDLKNLFIILKNLSNALDISEDIRASHTACFLESYVKEKTV